jgi:hypothetical protein
MRIEETMQGDFLLYLSGKYDEDVELDLDALIDLQALVTRTINQFLASELARLRTRKLADY